MNDYAIEIRDLNKTIKDKKILNNVNLTFKKGKIYGIIGRNGCGKSMLFKAISGLIIPTTGTIKVFGKEVKKGYIPESLGVIIENPGFIPTYSAFKNLKLLADIKGIISDEDIINSITIVGLDPNDKKPVRKFSLGMKQRLGIAQAIMENPKLLILDEPMNALDKDGVSDIRTLLKKLNTDNGTTILLTSHNKEDIDLLCDEIFEMEKGSLI